MKIAIAGAGIGGLAAASLLHDAGHEVVIFDQFTTPRPVGSGLMVQPVGQAVLAQIGALDNAIEAGHKIAKMRGRDVATQNLILDESYEIKGDGVFGLAIHRSGLFDALHMATQQRGIEIVPDFRVVRVAQDTLHSGAGDAAGPFDLIIDALGATSPLSPMQARALPYGAVWATVPWQDCGVPKGQLSQRYVKAQNMVGVLPVGLCNGIDSAAIFWSLPVATFDSFRAAGVDAWRSQAAKLWPEFSPFADHIKTMGDLTFARYSHGTAKRPYADNIVQIGDSAHCASPQMGQGANMALLDAQALTQALQERPLTQALPEYHRSRWQHVRFYQMLSATFTPMYQSESWALPLLRDKILFPMSRPRLTKRILSHIVRGDILKPIV